MNWKFANFCHNKIDNLLNYKLAIYDYTTHSLQKWPKTIFAGIFS